MVVDGAQSVPHMEVDVKDLNCDLLSFSSHKMCGPSGVGVLYGKKEVLERMKPFEYGGDMIYEVEYEESTFNKVPYRFEAGTPNIEGVIGFGAAIDYLSEIGMKNIEEYEKILTKYFLRKVKEIPNLTIYGSLNGDSRAGVFSFNITNIHSHDVSAIMDQRGVAIRGGHHCAMPLIKKLGVCATSRISLYFYNTLEEIDYIVDVLSELEDVFKRGDFSF
jgi:cysteine desulfurase/selenocysteine lyase